MKKWSELIFGGIITIVIIAACAIVPVAFYQTMPHTELPAVNDTQEPESMLPDIEYGTLSREERAKLYLINKGELFESGTVPSINSSELGFTPEQYSRVCAVFDRALRELVMDGDPRTLAFNTISCYNYNFYIVDDGNGTGIRYLDLYMEWKSDWSSWFKIHIDIDTEEIYYVYYSAKCVANEGKYKSVFPNDPISLLERVTDLKKSGPPQESVMVENGITTYLCILDTLNGRAPYTYSYIYHTANLVDFKAKLQYSEDINNLVLY